MSAQDEDFSDLDPGRQHGQEPAEGGEEPGGVSPSLPHSEEPSEGGEES